MLKKLREQAQELIDFGNTKEQAKGIGMNEVLDAIRDNISVGKDILGRNGYYVENLWSETDVQGKFNATKEDSQKVLNKALTNEATMEQIWLSIDIFGEMFNLEPINHKKT